MKNEQTENSSGQNQGKGREKPMSRSNTNQEDISQVDRQEGEMNNGELGGDLKKETRSTSDIARQK